MTNSIADMQRNYFSFLYAIMLLC